MFSSARALLGISRCTRQRIVPYRRSVHGRVGSAAVVAGGRWGIVIRPFRRLASSSSSHGGEHHSSGSDTPWIIGAVVVTVPILGYLMTAGSPHDAHAAGGHDDHGEEGGHHGKPAPSAPKNVEEEPEEAEEESEEKVQPKEEEEDKTDDAQEEDKGDDKEGAKKASDDKRTIKVDGSVKIDSKGDAKPLTSKPEPIKTGPDGSAVSLKLSCMC